MKYLRSSIVIITLLITFSIATLAATPAASAKPRKPGVYAVFDTSMGTFVCQLYDKQAPETVKNFIGLAEGTKEWRNTRKEVKRGIPYYNGTIFYRVVKDSMIQGGDITGAGSFSPVPDFPDEFVPALRFSRPGVLAMANGGRPNSNGAQFFITVAPAPHLNNRHTIFGQVVEGLSVVEKISNVHVDVTEKPLNKVLLNKITIERVTSPGSPSAHR